MCIKHYTRRFETVTYIKLLQILLCTIFNIVLYKCIKNNKIKTFCIKYLMLCMSIVYIFRCVLKMKMQYHFKIKLKNYIMGMILSYTVRYLIIIFQLKIKCFFKIITKNYIILFNQV